MRKPRSEVGRRAGVPSGRFESMAIRTLTGPRGPFSVQSVRLAPGARTPALHHARTTEFFLVLRGSLRATIDGEIRRMKKGDFACLLPGVVHEFLAGNSVLEVLAVFSPPLASDRPDIVLSRSSTG